MKVQMLRGPNGQPEYAVLSIEDFNRLAQGPIEIDEDGEVWESLPYEADGYDDVCLPHMEKGKPQAATRERFAATYDCTPEQLAG